MSDIIEIAVLECDTCGCIFEVQDIVIEDAACTDCESPEVTLSDRYYSTGMKPGAGTFVCDNCGKKVHLKEHHDKLPPCPQCAKTIFLKEE